MANKKTKRCQICQTSFRARKDAKTCSPTCRKRLQRALQGRVVKTISQVESRASEELHKLIGGMVSKHLVFEPIPISDERGSIQALPINVQSQHNEESKVEVHQPGRTYQPQAIEPNPGVNDAKTDVYGSNSQGGTVPVVSQYGPGVIETHQIPVETLQNDLETPDNNYPNTPVNSIWTETIAKFRHRWVMFAAIIFLVVFPLLGGFLLLNSSGSGQNQGESNGSGPLALTPGGINGSSIKDGDKFSVNIPLEARDTLIISPTEKPKNLEKGQIFLDQKSNKLFFYDGDKLHELEGGSTIVNNTIQGPTNITNSTVINNIIQGSGSLSAGTGLALANGVLSNTGILSLQGQTGSLSLSAGSGISVSGLTISNTGVRSLSGTANQINVSASTGSITLSLPQNIATGSTPTFAGINLGSALQVSSGGTGVTSFASNALLLGNGAGAVQTTNVGTTGQCLIVNGSGVPTFQSCASGGGVFAGSSQTPGYLTKFDTTTNQIVDSLVSEAGSTVTVHGDLEVNGIINAVTSIHLNGADINTAGTLSNVAYLNQDQTFSGHNIFKTSSNDTAGFQIQDQDGTSNLFIADTVNNRVGIGTLGPGYRLDVQGGDINTSGIYRVNGAQISSANLSNDSNLAKVNGANIFTAANTFTNTVTIQAANSLTLGSSSNLGSITFHDGVSSNTATLQLAGALSGDVNFGLPVSTGTQTICTIESGNCAGSGSGVTGSGTTNKLAKFTDGQEIGDSSISDDGTTVTVAASQVIQGALGLTIGNTGVNGQLVFKNGTNAHTLTLQSGATTSDLAFTLPTGDGSNGDCLQTNGSGVLAFSACTGGAGGGVTSINTLTGVLNVVGTANQISVSSAGDTITLSLPQDINTGGNANFRTVTLTGQAAGDNLIVANAISGATGKLIDLKVNNVSQFTVSPNGDVNTTGQYQINGSQISSANLSNDSNLAKLDGTGPQIFTGDNEFTGTVLAQLDSPTAFQVQNSTGTSNLLVADTTTTRLGVGTATPGYTLDVNGDINTSGVYRINGVTVCSSSGCTAASGSGDYIQNGTAPQAADFNITGNGTVGGTLTAGTVNATSAIQLNGANINTAGTLTNVAYLNAVSQTFTGANTFTGDVTIQNSSSTGFQVMDGSSNPALQIDTSGQYVQFGNSSQDYSVDVEGSLFSNRTVTSASGAVALGAALTNNDTSPGNVQYVGEFDNIGGTGATEGILSLVNLDTVNPVGAAIILNNLGAGFTNVFDNQGTLISGAELNLLDGHSVELCDISNNCGYAAGSGDSDYIQNGTVAQTADFNITGTGTVANLNATTTVKTGGTTRIDASGNLSNIGNITGTGAITIGGSGIGNGVTIQSALNSGSFRVNNQFGTAELHVNTTSNQTCINCSSASSSLTVKLGAGNTQLLNLNNGTSDVFLVDSAGATTIGSTLSIQGSSLGTTQTTFNLLNTTPTTINFGGGASTAINIGPASTTATSINIAGGGADTGCTVAGATGNLTCSGSITTNATSGSQGWWSRSGSTLQPVNSGDVVSSPGSGASSERFGASTSTSTFVSALAVGNGASVTADNGTAIGAGGTAGNKAVAVGQGAVSSGSSSVAVGNNSTATNTYSVALGNGANSSYSASIAIGRNSATTAANQLVIGASGGIIQNAYIGGGVTNSTPSDITLHATGGSGTDIAGASLALAAGQGTGAGIGGNLNFQIAKAGISGSTLNSLSTVFSLSGTNGSALFKNASDSATAFQIQLSDTTPLFNADTVNGRITIGNGTNPGAELYVQSNSDTVIRGKNTGTADLLQLANNTSDVFTVNNSGTTTIKTTTDSATAFQVQNSGGSNLLVADTANSRVGINTGSLGLNTNLNVYNGGESTTQTDFTQNMTNAGINFITDYTQDAYTGGLFWSTQNNNPTSAKAGIYTQLTNSGSKLLFGTSSSYSAGLTNTALTIGYNGDSVFRNGTNSSTGFQVQNAIGSGVFTINTSTGATLTSSLYVDTLGSGSTTAVCWNSVTLQVSSCASTGSIGYWNRTGNYLEPATTGDNIQTANAVSGSTIGMITSSSSAYISNVSSTDSDWALATQVSGDANRRFILYSDGYMEWGNGTATQDTNLYRNGAGILATDGDFFAASEVGINNDGIFSWGNNGLSTSIQAADNGVSSYMQFQVNGTPWLGVGANGAAAFQRASDSTDAFEIQNAGNDTILGVDTTGNGSVNVSGVDGWITSIDQNSISFSRDSANYIEASDAAGLLYFGAGGASDNFVLSSDGRATFKNTTNSTAGFQVQNTAGTSAFNVDTTHLTTTITAGTDTATLGTELFTGSTSFTSGSGWTSNGLTGQSASVTHTTGTTAKSPTPAISITNGNYYLVTWDITNPNSGGTLNITLGGQTVATYSFDSNDSGSYTLSDSAIIQASSTANLSFTPNSAFTGTVGNISIKQLTHNDAPALVINNTSGVANLEVRASSDFNNQFMGLGSGAANATGYGNLAVGSFTLQDNVSGIANTALGQGALQSNINGDDNAAIGFAALNSNTSGSLNVALGNYALNSNLQGSANVAIGSNTLQNNTDGYDNIAIGHDALIANTTGSSQVAIGSGSLQSATTAGGNTAVGYATLRDDVTGYNNTAIGQYALEHNTWNENTAVGTVALRDNTTGGQNTALGTYSLSTNTTGNNNLALGYSTLNTNVTGNYNTAIGDEADVMYEGLDNATAIGSGALVGSNDTIILGYHEAWGVYDNVGIGTSYAQNPFEVAPNTYHTGTISQSGGSGTVVGSGTTFTLQMVGATIFYPDGSTGVITGFTDATHVTSNNTTGGWPAGTSYAIVWGGFNVNYDASVWLQNTSDTAEAFSVVNVAGQQLFNVNTTDGNVNIYGTGSNGGAGRLTFGDYAPSTNEAVWVGEAGTTDTDTLQLQGANYVTITSGSYSSPEAISNFYYDSGRDSGVIDLGTTTSGAYIGFNNNNSFKWSIGADNFDACGTGTSNDDLYFYTSAGGCALQFNYTGEAIFLSQNDSSAFRVNNQSSASIFNIDTVTNAITLNGGVSNGTLTADIAGTGTTRAICHSGAAAATENVQFVDCTGTPAADYAESYPIASGATYGDIVATGTNLVNTYDTDADGNIDWGKIKGQVTQLVKTDKAYQTNTIGIISENDGDFSSVGHNIKDEDNPMPVALNGRVPVNVASNSDPIQPGDYITTSTEPGKAAKATGAGLVIGKALEGWSPGSGSQVMVFVEQGYWPGPSPASTLQDGGDASLNSLMASTANINQLTAENATITNLTVNTATIATLHITGEAQFDGNTVSFSDNVRGVNLPIDNGEDSVEVNFGSAYPDADYAVQCTPSYNTNCFVTDKTAGGFKINFGNAPADNNQKVDWFVVR